MSVLQSAVRTPRLISASRRWRSCSETPPRTSRVQQLSNYDWSEVEKKKLRGTCHAHGGSWEHRQSVHQNSHWTCVRWQIAGFLLLLPVYLEMTHGVFRSHRLEGAHFAFVYCQQIYCQNSFFYGWMSKILAWDPEWMLSNSTVLKSTFLDGIRSVVSIFTEFIFRFYTHEITSIDSIQQWSAGLSLNDACRYTSWRLDFSEYLLQRIIIEVNHAVSNRQVYYIHIIYSYETLFTSKW